MERLLVTGVDTLLGSNLALALSDRCEVLGLHDCFAVESPAVRTAAWNADSFDSLSAHFDEFHPQWLIHCGPLCGSSWDREPDSQRARREPQVVARLASLASSWGATLIVVSSDAVFSGPRMFHDECSPATNSSHRAALVREMERAAAGADALVARTHAYGWACEPSMSGFAEQAFERISLGRGVFADGHSHATPILATDLAEILWQAHETRLRGLYHIAGAERTSSHRFVAELAASFGLDLPQPLDGPASSLDFDPHAETSLSSKRARRMLNVSTPLLREGLNRFVEQRQNGWHCAWHMPGSVSTLHEVAA